MRGVGSCIREPYRVSFRNFEGSDDELCVEDDGNKESVWTGELILFARY